jgi:TRAP-type C4-dicarboxylate transport system permease small subunit
MRAMSHAGEQGYKALLVIADWASYAILCIMAVVISVDVVCRFFFGFSIQIAEEVASLSLIAMVFLSLGGAFEEDSLLRVDAFYNPLPEGVKRILDPAFHLMGIAVTAFYIFYLSRLALNSFSRDIHANSDLASPNYLPQSVMVLGLCLLALALVVGLLRSLTRRGVETNENTVLPDE